MSDKQNQEHEQGEGPKYHVDIEGTVYDWPRPTITTEEILKLGGLTGTDGVLLIDADQNQRTLKPGETIELKPGLGFSKKVKFRRGASRIEQELALVRNRFPDAEEKNGWVRIPAYPMPPGWGRSTMPVVGRFLPGYPGAQPYGIYVPSDVQFQGGAPNNFSAVSGEQPPFDGRWGILSWTLDGWAPAAEVTRGTNFLNWVLSFANRFAEGR